MEDLLKVLAFDTSGAGCSAAVLVEGRLLAHRAEILGRGHAERIMPMIREVMEEAGVEPRSLDLLGVTTGPGAFTGLRIGLAAARGLALAIGAPALGITSFDALATEVPEEARSGRLLVVAIDSKRDAPFLAVYGKKGEMTGTASPVMPADWEIWLPEGPLLLVGDAAARLAQALPGRDILVAPPRLPDAAAVARLAEAAFRRGERPAARPLYLRAPDTTLSRSQP